MGIGVRICMVLLGCGLFFGCAASNNSPESIPVSQLPGVESAPVQNDAATGAKLLRTAHSAIGTPYVLGGTTPRGFDCSGFVRWAYDSIGIHLPRTAREQSVVGEKIASIEDMKAGDIVAFRHPKRGYHTGIYVGEGKFIHSPRKRSSVRINSLSDSYFASTLLGARRVDMKGTENLVAQAQCRLDEYAARNKTGSVAKKATQVAVSKSSPTAGKSRSTRAVAAKNKKGGKTTATASRKSAKSVAARKAPAKTVASRGKQTAKSATRTVAQAQTKGRATQSARKAATQSKKSDAARTVSMVNKKASNSSVRRRSHS